VIYVNGIPLVVIEAKRPGSGDPVKDMVFEGTFPSTSGTRSPMASGRSYAYAQLLVSISGQDAYYATTETPRKFWGGWREEEIEAIEIERLVNDPLAPAQRSAIFSERPEHVRRYFDSLWSKPIVATAQDNLIVGLLRPDRLLEFVRYFLLFDRKKGKIAARYQQVFGVKAMLERIGERNREAAARAESSGTPRARASR
jgi:type I restriction enzyme, R subunit